MWGRKTTPGQSARAAWLGRLCALTLVCGPLLAQTLQVPPEKAIKARQAAYFLMGQEMARINATLRGNIGFDRPLLQRGAELLSLLNSSVQDYYVPGSEQGDTRAVAAIWQDMARFKRLAQEAQTEIQKLKEALARDDLAATKNAYGNASKACKNCHDVFKKT